MSVVEDKPAGIEGVLPRAPGSATAAPGASGRRTLVALAIVAALGALAVALGLGRARGDGAPGTSPVAAAPAPGEPHENARAIVALADEVGRAVDARDRAKARDRWHAFSDRWLEIENPIGALDRAAYQRIEARMQDVAAALPSEGDWSPDEVRAALAGLRDACLAFANAPRTGTPAPQASPASTLTVASYLAQAHEARARVASGDAQGRALVDGLRAAWGDVEGRVLARDKSAYTTSEETLAQAKAALSRRPPDAAAATRALERLETALEPLAAGSSRYGAIDAAAILLREGAEALVVLAALAAYLAKLGAADKTKLVWIGGAVGVAASLALGLALARLFEGVAGGARRELMEGVSSLVAAGLLVVVGQWLHARIHRGGWKREVTEAVREGKGFSLALVAFFAVFREGGETVLFYAGIAPATAPRDIALGIAIGLAALVALAFVVLGLGKKIPFGPFFTAATALLWILAVKFVGEGVHALQAAGTVSATPLSWMPSFDLLGIAPTVETCLAQLGALLVWTGFALGPRLARRVRAA